MLRAPSEPFRTHIHQIPLILNNHRAVRLNFIEPVSNKDIVVNRTLRLRDSSDCDLTRSKAQRTLFIRNATMYVRALMLCPLKVRISWRCSKIFLVRLDSSRLFTFILEIERQLVASPHGQILRASSF